MQNQRFSKGKYKFFINFKNVSSFAPSRGLTIEGFLKQAISLRN